MENEETNYHSNNPTNKKNTIINFLLIITIFVGLLIYMLKVDGIENIINVLNHVNYKWVFIGIIFLLINWFCEAINLYFPMKKMYNNQTIKNAIKVSMIGLLFNNLTPFSSGGQPMQAYQMTKTGKRASDAMSALTIKFVITQIALVVTTLIIALIEFNFLKQLLKDYMWIAILGVAVNIFAIIIVILAGVNKKIITTITHPIIRFLGRIHLLRKTDEKIEKLDKSIENFNTQFKLIKSEKKMVIKMFIIGSVQCLAYYSITYAVYKAFGNSGISFFQIIPTQALLLLIMTFIPTPGSGLGAEGGFYLLFKSIFRQGTINMSILFWRMYTFYLPIIVGLFFLRD